jgi:AbrB family looped-hinge helix DNA binding protein
MVYQGVIKLSKVTAKYQITIPPNVRKELGILPGTEVDIARDGKKYYLIVDPIREIRQKWTGKYRDNGTTMDYMNEIRGKVE